MLIRGIWSLVRLAGTVWVAFFLGSRVWDALGPELRAASPIPVRMFDRLHSDETAPGYPNAAASQRETGGTDVSARFLVWLAAALLLPVFSIGFIRAMVRKDTNGANAATLGLYSAADALLAYLLLGAALSNWVAVSLFIAAIGGSVWYNLCIMHLAQRREGVSA